MHLQGKKERDMGIISVGNGTMEETGETYVSLPGLHNSRKGFQKLFLKKAFLTIYKKLLR